MIITCTAERKYLALPAYSSAVKTQDQNLFRVFLQEENRESLLYHFLIPKREEDPGEPDWYAYVPIGAHKGKSLIIKTQAGAWYVGRIMQTDELSHPVNFSAQEYRPRFHYTPPVGWLNDPNGLIYVNGEYHLYHQHNPLDVQWGNMSWGHAVSRDLVHFEWVSDVLFPDENGSIFSGCAILNERACFGLPADAILFFYTAADEPKQLGCGMFTQRMAYSLDGGTTLVKYKDWCLPLMEPGNRDPKVFWHKESNAYIMILYLSGNRFAVLRSEDLEHWEQTQLLEEKPMWECPDLLLLRSRETAVEKWAFMSADGYYFIGSFDGYRFIKESGLQMLYSGKLPYAAQSFSNTGGRVISMSWLRIPNRRACYTGAMSLAREFHLGMDGSGGYYIRQSFVSQAKDRIWQGEDQGMRSEDSYIREWISPDGRFYRAEVK